MKLQTPLRAVDSGQLVAEIVDNPLIELPIFLRARGPQIPLDVFDHPRELFGPKGDYFESAAFLLLGTCMIHTQGLAIERKIP